MDSNEIHPTVVIGPSVTFGRHNIVLPYSVILGPAVIGDDNWIGPHVSIGTPAQYRSRPHTAIEDVQGVGVAIGNNNRIREYVTIHQGSIRETQIANDCFLMAYSHIPHDATLENGVTLANAAQMGGYTWLGEGANIGLGVDIRQRAAIGPYAMVGMNSTVTSDVPPFSLAMGSPARIGGANRIGLQRNSVMDDPLIGRVHAHYLSGTTDPPDFLTGELAEMIDRFISHSGAANG